MPESRPLFAVHNKALCHDFAREANHDEPDDGIRNCGRRYIAGLLFADDAFAEPPRKSEPPRDGFLPDGANYTAAEGWSISSRFGGDSPAFDNFRQSERFSRRR